MAWPHPHFQRMSSWLPSGLLSSRAKKPCAPPQVRPRVWVFENDTLEHRWPRTRRGGVRHQPADGPFARTGALRSAAIARCQPCRVLRRRTKARRESSAAERRPDAQAAPPASRARARRRREPHPLGAAAPCARTALAADACGARRSYCRPVAGASQASSRGIATRGGSSTRRARKLGRA